MRSHKLELWKTLWHTLPVHPSRHETPFGCSFSRRCATTVTARRSGPENAPGANQQARYLAS
jgi:hypothetical protein